MIKYVELTAPEASAFRQAKILSIECQEGDFVKEGETLFKVQSGAHEVNLPATKSGRIVELIATVQENITLSTALLLLETEVSGSTASRPISPDNEANTVREGGQQESAKQLAQLKPTKPTKKAKSKKVIKKKHEQQSLNLAAGDLFEPNNPTEKKNPDDNEVVLTQTVAPPPAKVNYPSQPSLAMPSSSIIEVSVPDIGADSAKVIEILVNVGDTVSTEDPLITLESDKASMDVPSPYDGVINEISVLIDQDISEGTLILKLDTHSTESDTGSTTEIAPAEPSAPNPPTSDATSSSDPVRAEIVNVHIPDIGGDSAKVIEILVEAGDKIEIEDPLVTLESDKASMDVPSSVAGVIQSIDVSIDQDVEEGTLVATVQAVAANDNSIIANDETKDDSADVAKTHATMIKQQNSSNTNQVKPAAAPVAPQGKSHASPSIRRFARELGVDLGLVSGSGRKGRVTHEDVKGFVKEALSKPAQPTQSSGSGAGIPQVPAQDFSRYGEIDIQPLNKIKRLTAENLHRSWLNVPHVTHSDESNISDLESFRKQLNSEYAKQNRDIKLSPLAFIVKAVVNGLQQYPQFNSSLEPGGENLIYKKYFNVGIAVDTPNGLVVPVVKDADKKSVAEIAKEMGELAKKARDKKLTMNDMSGACITISSLGGIGGTGFTPIVNTPEVAILGVSRSKIQPVWNGSEFEPGMILPLSLSYDHRVIDGAEAARFTRHIAAVLEDVRRLTV